MQKPLGRIDDIAASGTVQVPGTIPLVRARTLSITTRLTFDGTVDADTTVYVYYSPDGNKWDTIALTSWGITFTISTTKQITKILDVPEHGHIAIKVTNGSDAGALSDVIVWYSIQSWPDWPAQSRGLIETTEVYD